MTVVWQSEGGNYYSLKFNYYGDVKLLFVLTSFLKK